MFANQLGTLSEYELQTLCIPLDRCLTIAPGPIDPQLVCELLARGFDQAPVQDEEHRTRFGLVTTNHLVELSASGQPLLSTDPQLCDGRSELSIGPFVTVTRMLEALSDRRAVLVVRSSSATGETVEQVHGLLTISDLNRQPFRAAIYSLLAELESGIAVLVGAHFQDPWDWVSSLSEEHQVRILGYWELTKRRGVDVGPIAAVTLSQLIQVLARSRTLLAALGFNSRNQFEDATGVLAELRNQVMHPVRPMVLEQADVHRVLRGVSSAEALFAKVETVSKRAPQSAPGAA
jgi:hypothetical protein